MLPSYITWMVTALSALNAVFLLRHYRDWTEPVQSSWIAVPRLTRYSASDEQQLTLHELTPSLIIQCNTHLPRTHRIARPGTRCPRCTEGLCMWTSLSFSLISCCPRIPGWCCLLIMTPAHCIRRKPPLYLLLESWTRPQSGKQHADIGNEGFLKKITNMVPEQHWHLIRAWDLLNIHGLFPQRTIYWQIPGLDP